MRKQSNNHILPPSLLLVWLGLVSLLFHAPQLATAFATNTALVSHPRVLLQQQPWLNQNTHHRLGLEKTKLLNIRGGGGGASSPVDSRATTTSLAMTLLPSAVETALLSGPWGVAALTGVASSVVVPLTMVRQGYSFSVGYGYSVLAMGAALCGAFGIDLATLTPLSCMAWAVLFYGLRLGSFLLLREFTVPSKRQQVKSFDKSPRLQRVPLVVSVSLFYALLTSPVLYAARGVASGGAASSIISTMTIMKVGVGMAWLGALVEAVADAQKFLAKRNVTPEKDGNLFVGPTGGVYRLCRHPNYLGEVVFWLGLSTAGAPWFGKNIVAWVCSVLGLYGIYGIMTNASKRLDGKQLERYHGQEKYDEYRKQVPAAIFPWL